MEKHFLEEHIKDLPKEYVYESGIWYNPYGDCIVCQVADEAIVAQRIDEVLTLYNSAIDSRTIGFQIKGVSALIKKFGWDGIGVTTHSHDDQDTLVSIHGLLLAAYESEGISIGRRKAYSIAHEQPPTNKRFSREELVPA